MFVYDKNKDTPLWIGSIRVFISDEIWWFCLKHWFTPGVSTAAINKNYFNKILISPPYQIKYFWFNCLSALHPPLHGNDDRLCLVICPMFSRLFSSTWNKTKECSMENGLNPGVPVVCLVWLSGWRVFIVGLQLYLYNLCSEVDWGHGFETTTQ